MDVHGIVHRAHGIVAKLPARAVSESTLRSYKKDFLRMWRQPTPLDPLAAGIAIDTYYHRRASLHTVARMVLVQLFTQTMNAVERADFRTAWRWAQKLERALERIEPALALEPPLPPGVRPWELPPSRWHQMEGPHPRRGENSKRYVLADLPADWEEHLWRAANDNWPYRLPLAVLLVVPVRSEELVPGDRPSGRSPGVTLVCEPAGSLAISWAPVKSHNGLYGTGRTTITVDPIEVGEPAVFLAAQCAAAGGQMVVSTKSKNALRKSLGPLGERALPESAVRITPSVLRNQRLADLKATFGGGEQVAAAAGHSTDRTQSKYGRVQHGRKRKGYLAITSVRKPRAGNVARTRVLAEKRKAAKPTKKRK